MTHDERRTIHAIDDIRDGECFACACRAEKHLLLATAEDSVGEFVDGARLITERLVGTVENERSFGHTRVKAV